MSTENKLITEEDIVNGWRGERSAPLLSVVCLTFNHANFLAQALDSILEQQTRFPFEIVVRDDASMDSTQQIIREYHQKYPQIINPILEPENTFSKGIRPFEKLALVIKSKYIAICDGDDFWDDPTKLQKQVDYLESNPECVMTFHEAGTVDEDGKIINASIVGKNKRHYSRSELLLSGIIPNLTRCYRNYPGEYPEELGRVNNGDMFFASFLSQKGYAQFLADIKPAYYRRHDGGIWTGISSKQKRLDVANTFFWLASYYNRIGRADCAARLSDASIQNIMLGAGVGRRTKIKIAFKSLVKNILHN